MLRENAVHATAFNLFEVQNVIYIMQKLNKTTNKFHKKGKVSASIFANACIFILVTLLLVKITEVH